LDTAEWGKWRFLIRPAGWIQSLSGNQRSQKIFNFFASDFTKWPSAANNYIGDKIVLCDMPALTKEVAMKIPSHETSSIFKHEIPDALARTQQNAGSSDDLRNKHKRNKME